MSTMLKTIHVFHARVGQVNKATLAA